MYRIYINGIYLKSYCVDDFIRLPVKGDYIIINFDSDDYLVTNNETIEKYKNKEFMITKIVHDPRENDINLHCVSNEKGY